MKNLDAVNPSAERIVMSARTGEGIDKWCAWLVNQRGGACQ
jgi:hydrogenase nickel incorporation protein HypB